VGIFPMMWRPADTPGGWKKMMDMVLTGCKVRPGAERIGLISRAVAPERLDEEWGRF